MLSETCFVVMVEQAERWYIVVTDMSVWSPLSGHYRVLNMLTLLHITELSMSVVPRPDSTVSVCVSSL